MKRFNKKKKKTPEREKDPWEEARKSKQPWTRARIGARVTRRARVDSPRGPARSSCFDLRKSALSWLAPFSFLFFVFVFSRLTQALKTRRTRAAGTVHACVVDHLAFSNVDRNCLFFSSSFLSLRWFASVGSPSGIPVCSFTVQEREEATGREELGVSRNCRYKGRETARVRDEVARNRPKRTGNAARIHLAGHALRHRFAASRSI